tara:strand:- start:5163 stop:5876 length:714 start_codon:yes stop_codon:yes gene_type:complete
MALPKIDQPLFNLTIPSTKEQIRVRPFLVKDEKILLIALESNDQIQILTAIQQIVQNCIQGDVDVTNLPTFDLEYLFVRLRNISVGNVVKLSFLDDSVGDGGEQINYELDLEDVNVIFPDEPNNIIDIDDTYKLQMKYPSFTTISKIGSADMNTDNSFKFITECIDKLFTNEEVWVLSDSTTTEKTTFLEGLSVETFKKINQFFEDAPKLKHTIKYQTRDGIKERTLQGLTDFFMYA